MSLRAASETVFVYRYLTRIGLIEIKESWPKNGNGTVPDNFKTHSHTPSLAKAFTDAAACFKVLTHGDKIVMVKVRRTPPWREVHFFGFLFPFGKARCDFLGFRYQRFVMARILMSKATVLRLCRSTGLWLQNQEMNNKQREVRRSFPKTFCVP